MINRSLLAGMSLFAVFGLATVFIFQKFLHLSIGHTVYYCQNAIKSLSIQLPQTLGIGIILIFILTVVFPLLKLLVNLNKISHHKKNLVFSLRPSRKLLNLIRKLRIEDKVMQINSHKLFAYCVGIKNPKIYISSGLVTKVNARELEAILIHEKSHLDNKDALVLTVLAIIRSFFPYLPILSDILQNFRIEREIRADQAVVLHQGQTQPLLSAMKKLLMVNDSTKFAFSLGIGELDALELRINMLLMKKSKYKKFGLFNISLTILIGLIVGFIAITPVNAIENHADGKDIVMICPNNGSCVSWCESNQSVNSNRPMENSSHPYSTK